MTCIAAVVDSKGKIWMGGDSCYSNGSTMTLGGQSKIRKRVAKDGEQWLIGCSGLTRFSQIVLEVASLPEAPLGDQNPSDYLIREWMSSLRRIVREEGGSVQKDGEQRGAGNVLVGLNGALFWIDQSFSVTHSPNSYFAIGSGSSFAEGILWWLKKNRSTLSPKKRIRQAIQGAALHYNDVGGRVDIIST